MTVHRPSIDVVVVNWNAGGFLRQCLESLARSDTHGWQLGRVVVVDNASSDGSTERLGDVALPLQVICNDTNRGFGAACNQGASDSNADYLLFVNPDAEVAPDAVSTVTRFMESAAAASVGAAGARIIEDAGGAESSASRFPTLGLFAGKMLGLHILAPRLFPGHTMAPEETDHSQVVDQIIGAFLMIRRPLFEKLRGFDERYFMYYEEVDLCLRMKQAGAAAYYLHDAHVRHRGRVSSDQVPAQRLFYSLRSRSVFAHTHWPRWQAVLLDVLSVVVEPVARVVLLILQRRWGEVRDTLRATAWFIRHVTGARS